MDATTARKICAAVHQRGRDDLLAQPIPRNIRRVDVERIAAHHRVGTLRVVAREDSKVDPFVKYVLACEDGARIETVRIPLEKPGRFVVCVSSQVGCAMGCTFCATGRLGLQRNLEAWEIAEQVRVVRRELPPGTRVHGVVFQGMGEPLANVERVIQAIRVLHDPCGAAIEQRAITVSTVGVPGAIRKLAAAGIRVRLGVSIAAARPDVRRRLVPVEQQNPLAEVLEAAAEFVKLHGDAPMLAVTTLGGVNTSDEDADALARLALDFRAKTGVTPRLSLVPYNPMGGDDPFRRPDDEEAERFRARLSAIGVPVVRRYSGGGDVGAACGQLVARPSAGLTGAS
ncbi:MAG: 23S rRNA (adenine(2503)-C(2))-methyltransferase RlmN [Myxococcales bacterium]|nr:23S rRNA (adenine(2503)-C(2))-methyltransferase RlmN [Myxococcales bacterium]